MVTFVFLSLDWINTKVTRLPKKEIKTQSQNKEREQKSKINKKKLKT